MLVLTGRKGDKIMIGDDIVLEVVEVRGSKVRLSFDAPNELIINREKVHNLMKEQQCRQQQTS